MKYADFIKEVRKRFATVNNAGLERFLGLSNGYLSKFESGKIKDPNKLLFALASKGFEFQYKIVDGSPVFISKPTEIDNSQNKPTKGLNDANFLHDKAHKGATSDISINRLTSQPLDEKILHEKANMSAFMEANKEDTIVPSVSAETLMEASQKEALVVVDGGVEQGVLIPVIAQGLSAGFGFDYDEGEIIRYIKVPAWLARKSKELVALPIYGESMEPTLARGDLAVCDKGGFKDDGIYVLRDQERGLMFCKRVLWLPGGWTIKSDNPSYEPMKVDDKAIEIIARVIAAIKEVK